MKFRCARCAADVRPANFGSDRNCAFNEDGSFTPDNWNCGTISALICGDESALTIVSGCDETVEVIRGEEHGGFIVLSRYKRRGCTSSALLVGDFWPARPLTLQMAEAWLAG